MSEHRTNLIARRILRPFGLLLIRMCDASGVLLFGLAGWIEFERNEHHRKAVNDERARLRSEPTAAVQPQATAERDYEKARGCAPSLNGLSPEEAIRRGR